MLYHLFEWFKEKGIRFPGSALFQFITFRVLVAVILSLVISTVFGKMIINGLKNKQIGESVRDLGLAGEQQKKGTPTMGGLIIILAILIWVKMRIHQLFSIWTWTGMGNKQQMRLRI